MFQLDNFWLILLIVLWVLPWKGWALWRAAKNNHKNWFIVLLVLNTLGILEILYLFVFGKNNNNEEKIDKQENLS